MFVYLKTALQEVTNVFLRPAVCAQNATAQAMRYPVNSFTHTTLLTKKSKKVKASHTRYVALDPELIPVYRQSARPQMTISHPAGGRLPLLSARPVVTFPATQHHRPLASTKLYCLVIEAHRCEQLAQGCYAALP